MTTILDARQGLSDALSTIPGWRASPYVGDQVNPPMIKVTMPAFDPRMVFGQSKSQKTFRCYAYAPRAAAESSERLLDELAEPTGTGSLIEAVQTSGNWTADVDYAVVINVGEITVTQFGTDAAEYFVRPFDVEVVW
jgi:hypothetical protein